MIPAWLETINKDIMNLYQGLSMRVAGLSVTEFRYGVEQD